MRDEIKRMIKEGKTKDEIFAKFIKAKFISEQEFDDAYGEMIRKIQTYGNEKGIHDEVIADVIEIIEDFHSKLHLIVKEK